MSVDARYRSGRRASLTVEMVGILNRYGEMWRFKLLTSRIQPCFRRVPFGNLEEANQKDVWRGGFQYLDG